MMQRRCRSKRFLVGILEHRIKQAAGAVRLIGIAAPDLAGKILGVVRRTNIFLEEQQTRTNHVFLRIMFRIPFLDGVVKHWLPDNSVALMQQVAMQLAPMEIGKGSASPFRTGQVNFAISKNIDSCSIRKLGFVNKPWVFGWGYPKHLEVLTDPDLISQLRNQRAADWIQDR